ncbi:MAG TPA: septum formation initiator family protein [Caldithrix abyssi]|uniref:Septum formation initiator family protein n=1 Tax=Caldithrix abyssi TaxID=187145 RepID=A0A7V5PQB8_CALAY|nr:septum formation initiator family protein [Caldithrix abyssi]
MAKKRTTAKKQKSRRINPVIIRIALGITALVLIILLFVTGPRGTINYLKMRAKKNQLSEEIDTLRKKVDRLDKERDLLKNDMDYIEKVAREQYNMKKKNEKVYKVIPKEK